MKFAVLYKRRGQLLFGAQNRTTAGVLIGADELIVIDAAVDAFALGAGLCQALNKSRSPVPHPPPTEWPMITASFLRGAGVKSWGTFVRDALLATVESDGSTIRFQPHENRGARDAFQPMGLRMVTICATASDEEVGLAAIRALDIAASREVSDRTG